MIVSTMISEIAKSIIALLDTEQASSPEQATSSYTIIGEETSTSAGAGRVIIMDEDGYLYAASLQATAMGQANIIKERLPEDIIFEDEGHAYRYIAGEKHYISPFEYRKLTGTWGANFKYHQNADGSSTIWSTKEWGGDGFSIKKGLGREIQKRRDALAEEVARIMSVVYNNDYCKIQYGGKDFTNNYYYYSNKGNTPLLKTYNKMNYNNDIDAIKMYAKDDPEAIMLANLGLIFWDKNKKCYAVNENVDNTKFQELIEATKPIAEIVVKIVKEQAKLTAQDILNALDPTYNFLEEASSTKEKIGEIINTVLTLTGFYVKLKPMSDGKIADYFATSQKSLLHWAEIVTSMVCIPGDRRMYGPALLTTILLTTVGVITNTVTTLLPSIVYAAMSPYIALKNWFWAVNTAAYLVNDRIQRSLSAHFRQSLAHSLTDLSHFAGDPRDWVFIMAENHRGEMEELWFNQTYQTVILNQKGDLKVIYTKELKEYTKNGRWIRFNEQWELNSDSIDTFFDGPLYSINDSESGTSSSSSNSQVNYIGNSASNEFKGNSLNNYLEGKAGGDNLFGNEGDDILIGGKGTDALAGGTGNDTYIYYKGDDGDVIKDIDGEDTLEIHDIPSSDITYEVAGDYGQNLIMKFATENEEDEDTQYIIIEDFFTKNEDGTYTSRSIENIILKNEGQADDTINVLTDIVNPFLSAAKLFNTKPDEIKNDKGTDDTFVGFRGNDIINGLRGNDTLDGGYGDDILTGGEGDDTLYGGTGNDTYHYVYDQDGSDVISDRGYNINGVDKLIIKGITPEDPADPNAPKPITLEVRGNNSEHLLITFKNDETLLITDVAHYCCA